MKIVNVHERTLHAPLVRVGALLDSLSSEQDAIWPSNSWPRMKLDCPLAIGAMGGHGPIRYIVDAYRPGEFVRFRFLDPKGFNGHHTLEALPVNNTTCILRHSLNMRADGWARVSWPLLYRLLHDALIEDALTRAERSLGLPPVIKRWSLGVRFLRWILSGGRPRRQGLPKAPPQSRT